jgi:hypothetical protein
MRSAVGRFAIGLSLCTSAHAATAALAAETATHRLTIHWSDPEGQFPFDKDGLVAEARALFAPLGIELDWAPAGSVVSRDHVQIILLAADRSGGRMGEHAMACVQSASGRPPAAWILVPRVRETLGLSSRSVPSDGPLLSRALARVMAHELVHLIAPQVPHAPGGLMNASLGREFLVGRIDAALDERVARAVRQAIDAWPVMTGSWPFPSGA